MIWRWLAGTDADRLAAEWGLLADRVRPHDPFLTFPWLQSSLRTLELLIGERDREVQLIMPFKRLGPGILGAGGCVTSESAALALLDQQALAGDHWDSLIAALAAHGCRALVLDGVPEIDPFFRQFGGELSRRKWSRLERPAKKSPWITIGEWPSYQDYRTAILPKPAATNLRKADHKLEKLGARLELLDGHDDWRARLPLMEKIEAAGWKKTVGLFSADNRAATLVQLENLAAQGVLRIAVLYVEDRPAAWKIMLLWNKRLFLHNTAFDPALAPLGPGAKLHREVIRRAFEMPVVSVECLGRPSEMKDVWATGFRQRVRHVYCQPSAAGRLLNALLRLQPRLKHLAQWKRGAAVIGLVAALGAGAAAGAAESGTVRLAMQVSSWKKVVFLENAAAGYREEQAAIFGQGRDAAHGPYLLVGPWRVGRWGARWEYRQRIPWSQGTIRGTYRTVDLLLGQTAVTVTYFQGESVLGKKRYKLEPTSEWRRFEVPVRYPPQGADSFVAAFGLNELTTGRAEFAELSVDPAVEPWRPGAALSRPERAFPVRTFEKAGNYRIEREGAFFWLVDPQGRPLYSLATDGPGLEDYEDAADGVARAAFLRETGFNSLAGWTRVRQWKKINESLERRGLQPLPLFVSLETNAMSGWFERLRDASGTSAVFPDPFDPAFEAAYRTAVDQVLGVLGRPPWFVGWFADNEARHEDLYRQVYSPHCGRALRDFLTRRYVSIAALNKAWGARYASFERILEEQPEPAFGGEAMRRDYLDFERIVTARYIDVTVRVIREKDPGRLIFSNRFNAAGIGTYRRVLDLYKRYDGIAVNLYPKNLQPGLSAGERDFLGMFHELTGKPVLVSEWSVPALDSGLYRPVPGADQDWSFSEVVGIQTERADQAARVTLEFFSLPFVVGSHWFTWKDFSTPARRANRGIVRTGGEPWPEVREALRSASALISP